MISQLVLNFSVVLRRGFTFLDIERQYPKNYNFLAVCKYIASLVNTFFSVISYLFKYKSESF